MHDAPWEHLHDVDEPVGGQDDSVVWTTVGFDIGSSTSQLVFSRITLKRRDSHYVISERRILHESEVILTPYTSPERIDAGALAQFIAGEYRAARLIPAQVDTGSIILTGLALSTGNSRAIADAVSDMAGELVAISAGDMLEARLAAHGAGVPALSRDIGGVLVHVDVGGGTTKLSAWADGKLLGLAAIDVGARLVTFDGNGCVHRVEPPAAETARSIALPLEVGQVADTPTVQRLAGAMARDILRFAGVRREQPRGPHALRTGPLWVAEPPKIAAVIFSGGVSEYVYGRERRSFGDLGPALGRAFRAAVEESGVPLIPFERGIRATVLGVSQHSAQLSGNTVYVSDEGALPLRNIPIVSLKLDLSAALLDRTVISGAISEFVRIGAEERNLVGVALDWKGSASFVRLDTLARAAIEALDAVLAPGEPLVVVVDGDVAGVLGARLGALLAGRRAVVCIDGIHVHDFDHVDIGRFVPGTRALPVVVKTLLFGSSQPRDQHDHHAHH